MKLLHVVTLIIVILIIVVIVLNSSTWKTKSVMRKVKKLHKAGSKLTLNGSIPNIGCWAKAVDQTNFNTAYDSLVSAWSAVTDKTIFSSTDYNSAFNAINGGLNIRNNYKDCQTFCSAGHANSKWDISSGTCLCGASFPYKYNGVCNASPNPATQPVLSAKSSYDTQYQNAGNGGIVTPAW